jgi:hypothetical protein
MLKTILTALALVLAAVAHGAQPVVDNERVTVWLSASPLPPAQHDFVAVSLSPKRAAAFGHKGETPGQAGSQTLVIELKDHPVPPIANTSGYPNAFPRARAEKLMENDRVIVWSYRWKPGEPTPMHFHDKDVVVVYGEDTTLKSTTPDGKNVTTEYKAGDIRFNRRNRVHTELLLSADGSAVMTELK